MAASRTQQDLVQKMPEAQTKHPKRVDRTWFKQRPEQHIDKDWVLSMAGAAQTFEADKAAAAWDSYIY